LLTVSGAQPECALCGHVERAHVLEDVPQSLEKRGLCAECDDWHDFTPAPAV